MIKTVEPDHRPETVPPIADLTCNCSCACSCGASDTATRLTKVTVRSDPGTLPAIHGKRGGA